MAAAGRTARCASEEEAAAGDHALAAGRADPKDRQISRAAQDLLDGPGRGETVATVNRLRAELESHYALMRSTLPVKAAALIAQGLRSATVGAWQRVLDEKLFSLVTPILESGGSLTQDRLARWDAAALPYEARAAPLRREAAWKIFVHSGLEWQARARQAVAIEMQAGLGFPYRPLWEQRAAVQRECAGRFKVHSNQVRKGSGVRSLLNPVANIMADQRILAFETQTGGSFPLLVAGAAYSYNCNPLPAPEELSAAVVTDIGRLCWMASIKRNKLRRMFPTGETGKVFAGCATLEDLLTACGDA